MGASAVQRRVLDQTVTGPARRAMWFSCSSKSENVCPIQGLSCCFRLLYNSRCVRRIFLPGKSVKEG